MKFFHFFIDNFPSFSLISWLLPLSLIWSFLALYISGFCKRKLHWKTGYTRKLFHFFIFISAYFYQTYVGISGVFILGWAVTLVLIYACFKADGNMLYEAIAREKDAPHRTKYIVYSYLATFAGGVLSNIFFGQYAIIGYAVTGIADAIAEPIGTRFGKHTYPVFSFDKNKISIRSVEGSTAVFLATFLIFCVIAFPISMKMALVYAGISFACMLTEALSPSGFDNLVLQIVASFLASICLISF